MDPLKTEPTDRHAETPRGAEAGTLEARALVADYARARGVRDPELLATLSRRCVELAQQSVAAQPGQSEELERAAVALAMDEITRHAGEWSPARLADRDVAPAERPAAMPPQPLGELHPVINPEKWVAAVQGAGVPASLPSEHRQ